MLEYGDYWQIHSVTWEMLTHSPLFILQVVAFFYEVDDRRTDSWTADNSASILKLRMLSDDYLYFLFCQSCCDNIDGGTVSRRICVMQHLNSYHVPRWPTHQPTAPIIASASFLKIDSPFIIWFRNYQWNNLLLGPSKQQRASVKYGLVSGSPE